MQCHINCCFLVYMLFGPASVSTILLATNWLVEAIVRTQRHESVARTLLGLQRCTSG